MNNGVLRYLRCRTK